METHDFQPSRLHMPCTCTFCQDTLYGGKADLKCKKCKYVTHAPCLGLVPSQCPIPEATLQASGRMSAEQPPPKAPKPVKLVKQPQLILVVHGIGDHGVKRDIITHSIQQMTDEVLGLIQPTEPAPSVRSTSRSSLPAVTPEAKGEAEAVGATQTEAGVEVFVEFIEWHSELHSVVDKAIDAVTPKTIETLRHSIINRTALDVIYYSMPHYCELIQEEVARQLHAAHDRFVTRHKDFYERGGKVHILGHSLGSLICYDLLSHQPIMHPRKETDNVHLRASGGSVPTSALSFSSSVTEHRQLVGMVKEFAPTLDPRHIEAVLLQHDCRMDAVMRQCLRDELACFENVALVSSLLEKAADKEKKEEEAERKGHRRGHSDTISYPVLGFCVHNFFLIGSPLGMFLTVRGFDARGGNRLPACKNVFNLYHPNDPVAYRLEPWVLPAFADVDPVLLTSFKAFAKLIKRDTRRAEAASLAIKAHGAADENLPPEEEEMLKAAARDAATADQQLGMGKARIDFVFPTTYTTTLSTYASVAGAHSSYWKSKTLMLFMISTFYAQLQHPSCSGHASDAVPEVASSDSIPPVVQETGQEEAAAEAGVSLSPRSHV